MNRKSRWRNPPPVHGAFARLDLLVVLAVLGFLGLLAVGALGRAKEKAQAADCLNHLHQLGSAVFLYCDKNYHRLPSAERQPSNPAFPTNALPRIRDLLAGYVPHSTEAFRCPQDRSFFTSEGSSYEWNRDVNGKRLEQLKRDDGSLRLSDVPLMYDYENCHPAPTGKTKNVLYADGHVDRL